MSHCVRFSGLQTSGLVRRARSGIMVHLIGASRGTRAALWRNIVGTTKTVLSAARRLNMSRIIYVSGYGVTASSSEEVFCARAESERLIENSDVPYTIIKCSYVLGPGDELTSYVGAGLRAGIVEMPGTGAYRIQPVWIDDLMRVLLRVCASDAVTSRSYSINFLGEPIALREFLRRVASIAAPKAQVVPLSLEVLLRRAALSSEPAFTSSELAVLVCDIVGPQTHTYRGIRFCGLDELVRKWVACLPITTDLPD